MISMKAVSNYMSTIILLFILIALFPTIYAAFKYEDVSREALASEALSYSIKRGEIRLSFKRLDSCRFLVYNYGSKCLYIEEVIVDGEPRNLTILVYNKGLGWIYSDVIPPSNLSIFVFDKPVSSFLTLVVNGTFYSVRLGGYSG